MFLSTKDNSRVSKIHMLSNNIEIMVSNMMGSNINETIDNFHPETSKM